MDLRERHVHLFRGRTSTDAEHHHTFAGTTTLPQKTAGTGHVHGYQTETSVDQNHSHTVAGTSGTPLVAPLGHVHRLQGLTSYAAGHAHTYDVYTGRPRALRESRARKAAAPPEDSSSGDAGNGH